MGCLFCPFVPHVHVEVMGCANCASDPAIRGKQGREKRGKLRGPVRGLVTWTETGREGPHGYGTSLRQPAHLAMMELILNRTSTDNSQFLQIGHLTNPLKVAYISYLASRKLPRLR